MKRKNDLFPVVCDEETIRTAIHKAALGKRKRKIVVQILENEDYYVQQIKEMLINKTYVPNEFKQDIIFDGIRHKERVISKPQFYPDQIIHWCVYLAMKPWIYPSMYEYSCGSIPGRGIHYGKRHISRWIYGDRKGTKYYLQMDIHKFYPSIKTDKVMAILRRKIKDEDFLELVELTLSKSDELLIGMLLSQVFANFFMNDFDHWLKQTMHVKHYVRYMDDMVVFGSNKRELHKLRIAIEEKLAELGLRLKPNWQIRRFDKQPLDFMGFRFYRNRTTIRKSIMLRISRRVRKAYRRKKPTPHDAYAIISYMGWIRCTDTRNFYLKWIKPYVRLSRLKDCVRSYSYENLQKRKRKQTAGMGQNILPQLCLS